MSLSDTAIRNAKLGVKPIRLLDGGGLYVEVAPSGGKWRRLKYRHGGNEMRLSLGTYPDVSLKAAPARRESARQQIAERDVPAFLRKLASYGGDPMTQSALALLILTATRPGELRGARWDEFNERAATRRIPASRMKMRMEHTLPLSKQALALLAQMRRLSGHGPLVFPSPFYPGKPLSDGTLNSVPARLGYVGMVTAHGFRGAYKRAQCTSERAKLMQWWADRLDALREEAQVSSAEFSE